MSELSKLTDAQVLLLYHQNQQKLVALKDKEFCPACMRVREYIEQAKEELIKRKLWNE